MAEFNLRAATAEDCPAILGLIRDLAAYERLSAAVRATEADLQQTLFGPHPAAEVLLAERPDAGVVGF
ncbi:MAG: N-acetyltransferase, partial [Oceanococcaceae bacterium]